MIDPGLAVAMQECVQRGLSIREQPRKRPAPLISDRPFFSWDFTVRNYLSSYLSNNNIGNNLSLARARNLRNDFLLKQPKSCTVKHNPHAYEAAQRRSCDDFINELAERHHLAIYSESNSTRDDDKGFDGSRLYYGGKDLHLPYRLDQLQPKHMVKMVDVDFYVDIDRLGRMAANTACIVLYTFMPRAVAKFAPSGSYSLKGTTFACEFSPRAEFTHELWDWNRDIIEFDVSLDFIGWKRVKIICNLHHKPLECGRALVLIVPKTRVYYHGVLSNCVQANIGSLAPLTRLSSIDHGKGVYSLAVGESASLFQEGTNVVYSMPPHQFFNCIAAARTNHISIETLRAITGVKDAYHLRSLFKQIEPRTDMMMSTVTPGDCPRSYHPITTDGNNEGEPPGSVVTMPVVDGCVVAVRNESSDSMTIQERIDKPRPDPFKAPPADVLQYMKEFTNCIAKDCHIGRKRRHHPHTPEDVLEKTSGKKWDDYKKAFDESLAEDRDDLICKAFQKCEAYPSVKPPRNISNVDKRHVVRYLRYTLRVSALLKENTAWYAFGHTPEVIAERVHEFCKQQPEINETDFSKFDGTIAELLRLLELMVYERIFDPEHHEELQSLFNQTLFRDFRTKYGVCYNCGTGRCSGSACTSVGNSLINAFLCFVVLRRCGLSVSEAYAKLGLYGGDDGLSYFPDNEVMDKVMKEFQVVTKSCVKTPGSCVGFLGRWYLDPWSTNTSVHDVNRAANKLHFSAKRADNQTLDAIAWRKAVSLYVTDNTTPILGDWAFAVLRCVDHGTWEGDWVTDNLGLPFKDGEVLKSRDIRNKWAGKPIFPGPTTPEEIEEVVELFIKDSPVGQDEVYAWSDAMADAKCIADFPPPLWVENMVVAPGLCVVVDDVLHGEPAPKYQPICKKHEIGNCNRGGKCHLRHVDKPDSKPGSSSQSPPNPEPKGKEKEESEPKSKGKDKETSGPSQPSKTEPKALDKSKKKTTPKSSSSKKDEPKPTPIQKEKAEKEMTPYLKRSVRLTAPPEFITVTALPGDAGIPELIGGKPPPGWTWERKLQAWGSNEPDGPMIQNVESEAAKKLRGQQVLAWGKQEDERILYDYLHPTAEELRKSSESRKTAEKNKTSTTPEEAKSPPPDKGKGAKSTTKPSSKGGKGPQRPKPPKGSCNAFYYTRKCKNGNSCQYAHVSLSKPATKGAGAASAKPS